MVDNLRTHLVLSALKQAYDDCSGKALGRKRWTDSIRHALADHAYHAKMYVCASGDSKAHWGEWLYDVSVLSRATDSGGEFLVSALEIAFESEWDKTFHEVLYDFQKLIVSRARLRALVCEAADLSTAEQYFLRLAEHVNKYKDSAESDTYMLCIYVDDPAPVFLVRVATVQSGSLVFIRSMKIPDC